MKIIPSKKHKYKKITNELKYVNLENGEENNFIPLFSVIWFYSARYNHFFETRKKYKFYGLKKKN